MLSNLITDRTLEDVQRWQELRDKGYIAMTDAEREEWNAGTMKGAYNVSDLNRVGTALNFVRDRLISVGDLRAGTFTAKTDWETGEVPTANDLTRYLGYVKTIAEALAKFPTTPPTPTDTGALNYAEANAIEQIILDVDRIITNMLAARFYCGELYAGEV